MKNILFGLACLALSAAPAVADEVTVHLRFAVKTPLGTFQDTLHFTEGEWNKRDPVAVEAAKQALADAWVVFRTGEMAEDAALQTALGKLDKIKEIDVKAADLAAAKARIQAELDAEAER